jgi:hypothetical protein
MVTNAMSYSRRRASGRLFVLPLIVMLTGCEAKPDAAGFSARDSLGVHVQTTEVGTDTPALGWRLDLEPLLDLGSDETAPGGQFFKVTDARRRPDGSLVVLDDGSGEVRFYGRDGRLVRSAGGTGRGPGEYRELRGLALDPDGSVLVLDPTLERLTTVSATGDLVSTQRLEPTGNIHAPMYLYRLGGLIGDSVVALLVYAYPADMGPRPTLFQDSVPVLTYGLDGALRDTLGEIWTADMYTTGRETGSVDFGRRTVGDVHAGEIYVARGGDYAVRVYSSDGTLRRILRLEPGPARPVTDADVEIMRNYFLERAPNEYWRRRVDERVEDWPRSEVKPWISNVLVDETGAVWVEEYEAYWNPSPRMWGVFSADGRWMGRIRLPGRFHPTQIGPDYVLGIATDELGVEHVRLLGLRR